MADVVVYDLDEPDIEPNWIGEIVHDFPGNEWRRVQRAKGYHAILVNVVQTFSDGKCTGHLPGRLPRSGRDWAGRSNSCGLFALVRRSL